MAHMKIITIGDIHLISGRDMSNPNRDFFRHTLGSFQELLKRVKHAAPDLVIFLGDLVDWISDENLSFVIEVIEGSNLGNWVMTPGNHDIEALDEDGTFLPGDYKHLEKWEGKGIQLSDRYIETPYAGLFLINTALSKVTPAGQRVISQHGHKDRNLLFTHVPIDTSQNREYILSVAPNRSMKKYVVSGTPDFYDLCLENNVSAVFSGHLHFPGLNKGLINHWMCNMGISTYDSNRQTSIDASYTQISVSSKGIDVSVEQIT
jgi:predicted MPP superfamily phosphohydrolase